MNNIGLHVRWFTIFSNKMHSFNTNQFCRYQSNHNQNQNNLPSIVDNTKRYLTKFVDGCRMVTNSNEYNIVKEFIIKSSKWSYKQTIQFYEKNIEKRDETINRHLVNNNKSCDTSANGKSIVCDSKNLIVVKNIKNEIFLSSDIDNKNMKIHSSADNLVKSENGEANNIKTKCVRMLVNEKSDAK